MDHPVAQPEFSSCSAPPPENDNEARDGYPTLAKLMGSYPDTAIFRRFTELNLLNLLRLQAEIQEMEHELQQIRVEDAESHDQIRRTYSKDFRSMRDNEEDGDSEQLDLLIRIGGKLQEYNSALALAVQLKGSDNPSSRELCNLRDWLNRPNGGKSFLMGEEAKVWQGTDMGEFITLFPRRLEDDAFTSFLGGRLLDIYHNIWGHRQTKSHTSHALGSEARQYSDERISRISNIIGAIISSTLPTLAILVLYFVNRMIIRIGLVIVFTAVFSTAIALFTTAKKVEIFSATAA
ncbi:hypothetical protein VFPPC_10699 [Pochonia chlamydosporia 170]|uniref:DUF6594 domain-containing protein n=1 Tax=Pochonia chlamydosporia 170 TaxID=1380566 RepID=A0A179F4E2_METCM|nr:hypothetical protein VFPPC_10699 [Pochonia chlamydosporia 170]OAQ60275.2 hypothetical protein VFPPC_10699 [Pochonia chlamydosporia 170]